jgi:aspartate aminotransferase
LNGQKLTFAALALSLWYQIIKNSKRNTMLASKMAENLIGSEIIKLAGEINEKIKKGEKVYNFTIGDFDPKIFPIPEELTEAIIEAYRAGHTNYPAGNGIAELRQAVAAFLMKRQGLEYNANDEVLIAGGARPLIYALYQAIVDPGEKVIFPVPSWNNNHYCHLSHAQQLLIETTPDTNFMPRAAMIAPHIGEAALLALCSPLNPTGTVFSKEGLQEICELVMEENIKRAQVGRKPLYIMYDQIYWTLTYGDTFHHDPVTLNPALRPYTIFIDGLSKAFAATGVRVGWTAGPKYIVDKMKSILSHVGAWAAKAEQVASAIYLEQYTNVDAYLMRIRGELELRLRTIYDGIQNLKSLGHNVDAIAPQAAIYLTVQFDLKGKTTAAGKLLENTADVTSYLLDEVKLAIVPFYAFGASKDSNWYRLSVGTCSVDEIPSMLSRLEESLNALK